MSADELNLAEWLATPEGPPERVWRAVMRMIATGDVTAHGSVEAVADDADAGAAPVGGDLATEDDLMDAHAATETPLSPDGETAPPHHLDDDGVDPIA